MVEDNKVDIDPLGDTPDYLGKVDEEMSRLVSKYDEVNQEFLEEADEILGYAVEKAAQESTKLFKTAVDKVDAWASYIEDQYKEGKEELLEGIQGKVDKYTTIVEDEVESSVQKQLELSEEAGLPPKYMNNLIKGADVKYESPSGNYEEESGGNPGLPATDFYSELEEKGLNRDDTLDHLKELEEKGEVDWERALEAEKKGKNRKSVREFVERRLE